MNSENQIVIYTSDDGSTQVDVNCQNNDIWLSQKQMASIFGKDTDTISLHLKNIYKTFELDEGSTAEYFSVVQKEGKRKVKRKIKFYNLDAIISVGYRVNSKRGTQFRIWANSVLKEYLKKGYAVNQNQLKETKSQLSDLKKTVHLLEKVAANNLLNTDESSGLLKVISDYSYALDTLDRYDNSSLDIIEVSTFDAEKISYQEGVDAIKGLKQKFGDGDLFGLEKDDSFKSSINTIYQTYDGKDLYPSIEEKAANLLYFIVKNHSFSDGNKRIAAFIFIWFLEKNNLLYDEFGNKRIADNALVALTLMIAESNAEEKDIISKVVINLINKNN